MSTCAARGGPRAEAQRERILCAALKCFIEHGFHAASMASIAATAEMSAGLMYRYFENKSAIVLAIIERQLHEGRRQVAQLRTSSDLAAELLEVFERWRARDPGMMNAALFLEMNAEATRDPQIAEALRASDEAIRQDLEAWMRRDRADGGLGLPAVTVATRAFILQCFFKGLLVSAVRQPHLDQAALKSAIDAQVGQLLSS
ncbi:MAG: TetR/AcrR family transcriptional regulator [Steroidobacteraceae bacterium]|nr:TetR/AcrR family transcriptional regulator [Steroidobacteraceae bacterium]